MKKDLLCFSHLDWNFVYQRPQHLLTRFANRYNVYYFEEPKTAGENRVEVARDGEVTVVKTFLRSSADRHAAATELTRTFIRQNHLKPEVIWYYTPMALPFTAEIPREITVFDSMDELSAFRFAPPELLALETDLLQQADIVFTGGNSLFEAKKHRHHNIHPFPSSIDKAHFLKARAAGEEPEDQKNIGFPRLGFYGVLDERFNAELLREVSAKKPGWQFIIIGPVVKISPEDLPKAENIHYLGPKNYSELPEYIRHWDVAMNMFALNESTRFISPTKTPEYLCAGLPVISTSITDVVRPYGELGLVEIADGDEAFIEKAEKLLTLKNNPERLEQVDAFLADKSWDETQQKMESLINNLY